MLSFLAVLPIRAAAWEAGSCGPEYASVSTTTPSTTSSSTTERSRHPSSFLATSVVGRRKNSSPRGAITSSPTPERHAQGVAFSGLTAAVSGNFTEISPLLSHHPEAAEFPSGIDAWRHRSLSSRLPSLWSPQPGPSPVSGPNRPSTPQQAGPHGWPSGPTANGQALCGGPQRDWSRTRPPPAQLSSAPPLCRSWSGNGSRPLHRMEAQGLQCPG